MIPGRPLALFHALDGVLQADAPGRISGLRDWSGNLNHTPATSSTNQGYLLTGSDGLPYMIFPRFLESTGGGSGIERFLNLPTSFVRNTSGTPAGVTLNCRQISYFVLRADWRYSLYGVAMKYLIGNSTLVGGFVESYGGFHSNPVITADSSGGVGDARWTGKIVPQGWTLLAAVCKSGSVDFYENNRASKTTVSVAPPNSAPGANMFIGAKQTGAPYGADGNLAFRHVSIFDRNDFTDAELDDIFGTIKNTWRLHDPTLNIHFDGDSITYGTGGTLTRNYPAQMPLQPGWRHIGNAALSGQTWQVMTANAATRVDPYHVTGADNVLLAWAGINDLNPGIGNRTPAQVITDCTAYITARRAAKTWKYIGIATTPPGFSTEAELNAMNNLWRQNYKTTCGADFLFDVTQYPAQNPIMRYGANNDIVTYDADDLHPNHRGNRIIGHGWADCLARKLKNPTTSDVPWLLV